MLPEQTRIEIGNRIRNFRVSHNLAQGEFAESIGISVNFLSELENGKKGFSSETLFNICHQYNISADYILLNDTPETNPNETIVKLLTTFSAEQLTDISNYIAALRQLIS